MQYRTANEPGPSAAGHYAESPAPPWDGDVPAAQPTFFVSLSVLVLVATSSFVMQEPALCDVLFPPVFVLTMVTGHMMSPLKLPAVFTVSLVTFALANYASIVFARDWAYEYAWFYLGVTVYLLVYFVFFAAFVGRFGEPAYRVVRNGYLIAAGLAAAIGVLAVFRVLPNSEIFFRDASMVRVQSTFGDPNVFAPFLVGAILLVLVPLVHGERMRLIHVAVLGLCLAGVALSFSRGAWLHLAISLVVFVAFELFVIGDRRANHRLMVGLVIGAPLGVGALALLLLNADLDAYLFDRLSFQAYDRTRFGNQYLTLELADQFLFGLGPGQFTAPRFTQDAHNVYLKVLIENGVVGLLAMLSLMFGSLFYGVAGVFRRGRVAPEHAACVAILVGVMVESLVIDTLHWRHLFLFLGLPVGLMLFERSRERGPAPPSFSLQNSDGLL